MYRHKEIPKPDQNNDIQILTPRPRGSHKNINTKHSEKNKSFRTPKYSKNNDRKPFTEREIREYHKQGEETDRSWYAKEDGLMTDESIEPMFLGDQKEFKAFENDIENINRARRMGTVYKRRKSQKAQALEKDQTRWEQNRIESAGMGGFDKVQKSVDNESEGTANILVLDTKPPFLTGEDVNTEKQSTVSVVKDVNSDLSIIAKKGSALLRQIRRTKDKQAAQERSWDLKGSHQGNLIGVKQDKTDEKDDTIVKEDGSVDYKASSSYKKLRDAPPAKSSKSIADQRADLPIAHVRDELLRTIRDSQVVVVVGETGSGKTTQLPQYILEDGLSEHGKIAITQPRRVAAMSVAKRVANERDCSIGGEVGYAIRFEDCTTQSTRIKYLTDGVLLRESLRSGDLEDYAVIIMDEAHERSLHTDILFGLLKGICRRRADLKLIVTSATLNAERFSAYFGGVPVFKVPGRTFPVDVFFSKTVCEDYIDGVVKQILSIHLTQSDGDILVFMTGQEDIEATCSVTANRLEKIGSHRPLLILPIYSALPSDLQAKVFERTPPGMRKCVIATNIAETSITLDGIKYVVDGGYCKLKVYNPRVGMDSLQVTPISRANADQRTGRAGRTAAGCAYRMYTLMAYNSEMLANNVPEIQRTNLGNVVLLLKSLGVDDLLSFEFMDPPPKANILNSMYQLWLLGALNSIGNLTPLGRHMAEFPLDPPLSKMLVFSALLGCSEEVVTIVSVLSVPAIFYRPNDRASESDATREKFSVPESDHLTLLRVYESWAKKSYSEKWCLEHFVHYKAMCRVREVRSQLMDIMKNRKVPIISCNFDYDIVRKSICSSYFHHSAKMKGIGEYANLRTRMPCYLHPSSVLYGLGYTPEYIVYHELILTSREYMRTVTAVNPKWLAELGPMFFALREKRLTTPPTKADHLVFQKTAVLVGSESRTKLIKSNSTNAKDDNIVTVRRITKKDFKPQKTDEDQSITDDQKGITKETKKTISAAAIILGKTKKRRVTAI